jgi:hypothetical protein
MNRRRSTPASCTCDPQLLGEIKGKQDMILESLGRVEKRQESHDARLRKVETHSAITGAIGGLMGAIGVNLE